MIPMRNRKKTLEVTMEEMRNFSFAYIEKYAPSKQQLRTYLLKKYLKANVPNVKKQDITDLIDIVLVDKFLVVALKERIFQYTQKKNFSSLPL